MAETHRSSDIYGILLDTTQHVLMLQRDFGDWTLPHIHVPDKRIFFPMVNSVCNQMRELLAANIALLRSVDANYSEDRAHVDLVYIMENPTEGWTPPVNARWINLTELEALPLARPEHRSLIDAVWQETETGNISPLRQAWACPGWFKEASTWIRDQLSERNYVLTAPIEQIKIGDISCLLCAKTDHGNLYFKVATSLPLFGNEPALLQSLSERYPDYVPAPLAIDPERRWMLMEDFGAELRSTPTIEKWKTAARRFAELQLQTLSTLDELFAIGCLDRRLNVLISQIDPLLSDEEALSPMSADEIAHIRAIAPRLKAMCSQLASYRVPYALNHGDLHSGNVTGEKLLFFDWTDACIAHPFLDLSTVTMDAEEYTPEGREQIVDAYLSQWTVYEPLDRLRDMWKLAEPLGALHQVISYQHILATVEPASKQGFLSAVPAWLRRMVQTMPE